MKDEIRESETNPRPYEVITGDGSVRTYANLQVALDRSETRNWPLTPETAARRDVIEAMTKRTRQEEELRRTQAAERIAWERREQERQFHERLKARGWTEQIIRASDAKLPMSASDAEIDALESTPEVAEALTIARKAQRRRERARQLRAKKREEERLHRERDQREIQEAKSVGWQKLRRHKHLTVNEVAGAKDWSVETIIKYLPNSTTMKNGQPLYTPAQVSAAAKLVGRDRREAEEQVRRERLIYKTTAIQERDWTTLTASEAASVVGCSTGKIRKRLVPQKVSQEHIYRRGIVTSYRYAAEDVRALRDGRPIPAREHPDPAIASELCSKAQRGAQTREVGRAVAASGWGLAITVPKDTPRCCQRHARNHVRHQGTEYDSVLEFRRDAKGYSPANAGYEEVKSRLNRRIESTLRESSQWPAVKDCGKP